MLQGSVGKFLDIHNFSDLTFVLEMAEGTATINC